MKSKQTPEEIKIARMSQVNKFIDNIFTNYEGIKTDTAKIILYRLIELTLASQNKEYRKDCRGMSIVFDEDKIQVTMPTESIGSSIEEIKEALKELFDEFLDIDDFSGVFAYRFFETITIHKNQPSSLEFEMDGEIWEGVCNYSNCFGSYYLSSRQYILLCH